MGAIGRVPSFEEGKKDRMVAIKDRCIGCGVCALACPREAIKLKKMADVVPPVTRKEAFLRYGQERMW